MATITNIKRISVDLYYNSEVVVRAKQSDNNTRYLNITCTDNGKTVRIDPDKYEVYAKISTPNYRAIHDRETVESDGTITVALTDSILNTAGTGAMEVNLYAIESESLISTMNIKLIIVPSVYDDKIEMDSDEFPALTKLIAEVTFKKDNYDKAETARVGAEKKRVTAENKRVTDESARVKAESDRVIEFNTLKTQSETATAGAEKVNIKSTSATDSYKLTITNRSGQSSTSPNLLNKLSMGTVTTLESDEAATASLSGNFGNQKINIGIPGGLVALQPVRNWSSTYTTIGETANCSTSDFNRTPIVGDVFTNLDSNSNVGTWKIMSVSGSSATMKLLSFTNLRGVDGKHGYGMYRYNGSLTSSATTCTRSLIQPTTGELYTSETIIDTNNNVFAITKDYTSGTSVTISFRYNLFNYMSVDDFEALFAPEQIFEDV